MSEKTKIEWTDATVNPIRARGLAGAPKPEKLGWYCQKVNDGCARCYAEQLNRFRGNGVTYAADQRDKVELFLDDKVLEKVIKWKRGRRIFWCDMTDLFADFVPDSWIRLILRVMQETPQHTHQILTKRPERMKVWRSLGHPSMRHLHVGVSVSDQKTADAMIPNLLASLAWTKFVSYEPALGPVDLSAYLLNVQGYWFPGYIKWVIAGGESGMRARPSHPDWFRALRDQCQSAGVPFFFKQWGAWSKDWFKESLSGIRQMCVAADGTDLTRSPSKTQLEGTWMHRIGKKNSGRLLDGREWSEFPEVPK